LLLPLNDPWAMLEASLEEFEPGFQLNRDQPAEQMREDLLP
jgi:antitoxin VapB